MSVNRTYWLDLFTGATWQEFLQAGGQVSGFRESRWSVAQRIKPGDCLLCYLTGISRFVGVLEVVSEPYRDQSRIWNTEEFPSRVRVKVLVGLTAETAVPVSELKDKLSVFHDLKIAARWSGAFRGSPRRWNAADGAVVVEALMEAQRNPIVREVNAAKLARKPVLLQTKMGRVTVPESEETATTPAETKDEATAHDRIQWLLLKLGNDMGLDVWVARNDRGNAVGGQRFSELPRIKKELPLKFDEATNRTVELIDVLWLKGNAIVAAFEIESTTSIYSGLLRMSDLVAMQPNLNIPLYLVAPDERRAKVVNEVNRPTFSRLAPPLSQLCRFVPFSNLQKTVEQVASVVGYLKPEFLLSVSESCIVEE